MVEDVWPLSYGGLPAVLSALSVTMFVSAVFLGLLCDSLVVAMVAPFIGICLGIVAAGRKVRVEDDGLVLEYGFPVPLIKIRVRDVVEVVDVNALKRGRLVRYFRIHLYYASLVVAIPVAYVVLRGLLPNPAYIPLIALPAIVGILVLLYFMFTGTSYRSFMRRAGMVVGTSVGLLAFITGALYRDVYGKSILSDPHSIFLAMVSLILLAIAVAAITSLASRHHVVIIEDAEGNHYAIGARSPEAASRLIKEVLKVVSSAEASQQN